MAEVLGAVGLVAPSLMRVRPGLTPLAAAGLVIIMTGATVVTALGMGPLPALFPLAVGLSAASVAVGRSATGASGVHRPVGDACAS